MPVNKRAVSWPFGSRIERVLSYSFRVLAIALGLGRRRVELLDWDAFQRLERLKNKRVRLSLPASVAYADRFNTRTASIAAQKKIFHNELNSLVPLTLDQAEIIAQPSIEDRRYLQFLQIKSGMLSELGDRADALGLLELHLTSESRPEIETQHPRLAAQRHVERKTLTLGLALCVAGMWSFLSVFEHHTLGALGDVTERENSLRSALLAQLDENRELSALGQLAAIKPEMRAPQGRLESLANITTATNDSTWWQLIELDDQTLRLTGRSNSASATLSALSTAFSEHDVRLATAVSDTSDGDQTFTIEVQPAETLR